jgi:DNA-binding MarR family transcriptional regulator
MASEHLVEDLLSLARFLRPGRASGMTPQQYWLLRHLRKFGPMNTSELAQALGITVGSATVACKRLEKAGLLTRERQVEDERVVQVSLTEQGCAQIDALRQKKREALIQLLNVLEPSEQETLQGLVARLLEAAEVQGLSKESKNECNH